jgi:hypothetical protein
MKQMLSVINTNSVMKNGLQIATSALVDGLWVRCDTGTPMHISHDQSRLIGWTVPLVVHFEPGIARSVSLTQLYETNEEAESVQNLRLGFAQKLISDKQEVVDQLKLSLSPHFTGQQKIVHSPQIAVFEEDLAVRAFSEIFEIAENDRDGLVPIEKLNPIGPGVYQIQEFVIFAHEYFRRALFRLNTLNAEFLKNLQGLQSDLKPRVALDRDMIGLAADFQEPIELMYTWGPSFKDEFENIKTGVTVHEADESERFFSGISRTEFWWKFPADVYEFEVEEIADRDHPYYRDVKQFACRYVHSRVPNDTGDANHLDGAVRMYSEEKMMNRLDVPINRSGKNSYYTKLWRVDGNVGITMWKSLISDYFRGNTLIGEYLGGVDNNPYLNILENGIINQRIEPKQNYVPYSMNAGDGIRIAISYQLIGDFDIDDKLSHHLVSNDRLFDGDKSIYTLDSRLIDFHKILISAGASTQELKDFIIVRYGDGYINFPTVFHSNNNLRLKIDLTLKSISQIVDGWFKRKLDLVIAFSIGYYLDDKVVLISLMGHIADVRKWLANPLSHIPTQKDAIEKWSEKIADYLDNKFDVNFDNPPLGETLHDSGLLAILRKQLSQLDIEYIVDKHGLKFKLKPESLTKMELELMESGEIALSVGCFIDKSTCMNCKSDYKICKCNSTLQKNVSQRFDKYKFIYPPYWTDRNHG